MINVRFPYWDWLATIEACIALIALQETNISRQVLSARCLFDIDHPKIIGQLEVMVHQGICALKKTPPSSQLIVKLIRSILCNGVCGISQHKRLTKLIVIEHAVRYIGRLPML